MDFLEINDYGSYLVLRKPIISQDCFLAAVKCTNNENNILQDALYRLLCVEGFPIEPIFQKYKHDYPDTTMSLEDYISDYYSLPIEQVNNFISKRKDGEQIFYVDNILANGYNEQFLLNVSRSDDRIIDKFRKEFREDISKL